MVVVPLLIWGLVQAFSVPDRYAIAGPPIHGTDGVAGSDSGGAPPQTSTSGRVQHPAVACAESLERLPEIAGKHRKRTTRRDLLHTISAPAVCIETTFPPELDLAAGVPVLAHVRTCYTKERPVRLTETIFAGDRNRLVYELGDLEALYERDQ